MLNGGGDGGGPEGDIQHAGLFSYPRLRGRFTAVQTHRGIMDGILKRIIPGGANNYLL